MIWNRDSNDFDYSYYNSNLIDPNDSSGPARIPNTFKDWVSEPQKPGAISISHDIYLTPVMQVGPSIDAILNSTYEIKELRECIQVDKVYDDSILNRAQFTDLVDVTKLPFTGTGRSHLNYYPSLILAFLAFVYIL